jgi:hypothetical protein
MLFAQLVETTTKTTTTTSVVWYMIPFTIWGVWVLGSYCRRVCSGGYRVLRALGAGKVGSFLGGWVAGVVVGGFLGLSALGFVLVAQQLWGSVDAARELSTWGALTIGMATGAIFSLGGPFAPPEETPKVA